MAVNKNLGVSFKDIEDRIDPFWNKVIKDIKDNLVKLGYGSGMTAQNIEAPRITVGDNSYKVELIMPDYYAFLDEGVRGKGGWVNPMTSTGKTKTMRRNTGKFSFKDKMPPASSMRQYMINKGIVGNTKRGSRGTESAQKQLDNIAWAMARSIYQQGLEQTDFYSDVVNESLVQDFTTLVLDELGEDVLVTITANLGQ